MKANRRLEAAPPYFLNDLVKLKHRLLAQGVDLIDFSLGDPDQPTPDAVLQRIAAAAETPANHRYPLFEGAGAFRAAMSDYYASRFQVQIDPEREVCALLGSKEGLAHLIWALVDPGDVCLIPDPGYPIYQAQVRFAGGIDYLMPLRAENGFLPDFAEIPAEILRRAKLMFLNYPNNPTGAGADLDFFARAVAFCRQHQIVLAHDHAYADTYFDGLQPPSVLAVPGAKETAVEFYSFSKPFNMAGWRLAAVVGNAQVLGALKTMKSNVDNGVCTAVQMGGVEALTNHPQRFISYMTGLYQRRRDIFVAGMQRLGYDLHVPQGSFYVWMKVPAGFTSAGWTEHVLERAKLLLGPGIGYGIYGEGYVRVALVQSEERTAEAIERMAGV